MIQLHHPGLESINLLKKGTFQPSLKFSDTFSFKNIPQKELDAIGVHPVWHGNEATVTTIEDALILIMDDSIASNPHKVFHNVHKVLEWLTLPTIKALSSETARRMKRVLVTYYYQSLKDESSAAKALTLPERKSKLTKQPPEPVGQVLHTLSLFS
ncbi:MAG: hypothetical protein K2X66_14405 [Cyanobacteria bacterium]|nr:hypothetical protein [Cyanobacteriota bacterium]